MAGTPNLRGDQEAQRDKRAKSLQSDRTGSLPTRPSYVASEKSPF